MRSSQVSRFSRVPSSHSAVIKPASRRPSPYRTSKPAKEVKKVEKQKIGPTDFNDMLLLINKQITSFSDIDFPDTVKSIDVKKNQISSFVGLSCLKELESIDVSDNLITNFRSFPQLPKLRSISLNNTPLSKTGNFKIALIILVGSSLRIINGERITATERAFAKTFPEECKTLLRLGWNITSVPPRSSEIQSIISKLTAANAPTKEVKQKRVKAKNAPRKLSEAVSKKLSNQEEEMRQLKERIEKLSQEQ